MKIFKNCFIYFFIVIFTLPVKASAPESFANLAEKLMPSVVNISTTQTIRSNSNLPRPTSPASPLKICLRSSKTIRGKASSLGSGFIINKDGTVVTNNHVLMLKIY